MPAHSVVPLILSSGVVLLGAEPIRRSWSEFFLRPGVPLSRRGHRRVTGGFVARIWFTQEISSSPSWASMRHHRALLVDGRDLN